jgi:group I intron endonuclease
MTTYAVYIVTNTINAKQYVGISKQLGVRWGKHKNAAGSAPALHSAIQKYGVDNFVFTHFANAFDFECAQDIERFLIKEHNTMAPNGYNLTLGGEGVKGGPMSEEQKDIRRKASNAYVANLTLEERKIKFTAKNNISRAGSSQTKESKAKTSKATKAMWATRRDEILSKRQATQAINKAKKLMEVA